MEIKYRGFTGKLSYDMDRDIYHVGSTNGKGEIVTAESAAINALAPVGIVLHEFRTGVDALLEA